MAFLHLLQMLYALQKGSAQGLCFIFGCVLCRCEGYLHIGLDLEEDKQESICFVLQQTAQLHEDGINSRCGTEVINSVTHTRTLRNC